MNPIQAYTEGLVSRPTAAGFLSDLYADARVVERRGEHMQILIQGTTADAQEKFVDAARTFAQADHAQLLDTTIHYDYGTTTTWRITEIVTATVGDQVRWAVIAKGIRRNGDLGKRAGFFYRDATRWVMTKRERAASWPPVLDLPTEGGEA